MAEPKTECAKCGSPILQSTADSNEGRCKKCSRPIKAGDVAEGMELGMRLLLGVFFGCLFAGLGYGIGAILGTLTGIIVATPFAVIGFIYGCFSIEINAMR